MAKETKWKRMVKKVAAAKSERRADFISTGVSCPGSNKLPKDETPLVKFQYSMPVPKNDEEAKAFYNLSLKDLIEKGVSQLGYTIDDAFKKALFGTVKKDKKGNESIVWADPKDVAKNPDKYAANMEAAQRALDDWRYDPETARGAGSGKQTAVADVVNVMVMAGQLPAEIDGKPTVEAIVTQAELLAAVKRFGPNAKA